MDLNMVGHVFCVRSQEWVGLVAYVSWGHVRLEGTHTPGEERIPGEDTYPEAIIGFHH